MKKRPLPRHRPAALLFLTAFVAPIAIAVAGPLPPAPAAARAQSGINGHWEGVMDRDGAKMGVTFDFRTALGKPSASFTSALWRVMDWPVGAVSYAPPKVHFEFAGTDDNPAVFEGALSGDTITGTFYGGEGTGTFSLRRAVPAPAPYRKEEVTFRNGGASLSGTLLIPRAKGPHPAIVLLHGSGAETRWGTNLFLADRYARRGVAALVYDKRGAGDSTGDWKTATYEDIADDAIAAIHLLRRRKDVRPGQIGIFGHSEGGTVAPLIASRSSNIAFVIAAAGVAGPAYKQDLFRVRNIVAAAGFTPEEVSQAMAFYNTWLQVARTGQGRDQLDARIPGARNEKWFGLVEPPPKDHWSWTEYRKRADFDSLPFWAKVRVPVLLVYGELEEKVPAAESIGQIESALQSAGNPDYTAILVPLAEHNLTVHPRPGPPYTCPMHPEIVRSEPGTCPICQMALEPHEPSEWWHAAPGLADLLTAWVLARVDATPRPMPVASSRLPDAPSSSPATHLPSAPKSSRATSILPPDL